MIHVSLGQNSVSGRERSCFGKDSEEIKWKVVPGIFRDNLCFNKHDSEQEKGNLDFMHDVGATDSLFDCLKNLCIFLF